jgi:hypothetical protein
MPVNRFDSPAQYNPINVYSPIPFSEMMQVVDYRTKKAESADALELKLMDESLANGLKTMNVPGIVNPVDVAKASGLTAGQAWVADYDKRLSEISSRLATSDKSDPMYGRELKKMALELRRAKSETGVLGRGDKNVSTYNAMQDLLSKNQFARENPGAAAAMIAEMKRFKENENDPNNILQPVGLGEYVDVQKESNALLNDISPETLISEASYDTDEDGNRVIRDSQKQGVTKDRVTRMATNAINSGRLGQWYKTSFKAERDLAIMNGATEEEAMIRSEALALRVIAERLETKKCRPMPIRDRKSVV